MAGRGQGMLQELSHVDALEVACVECGAGPGEPCVEPIFQTLLRGEEHPVRVRHAGYHVITGTAVPESDVVVWTCAECEWVDAR